MIVLGIDPGIDGGLAVMDGETGQLLSLDDMPTVSIRVGKTERDRVDTAQLAEIITGADPAHVVVEKVGGMPTDAAVWAFNFGLAAGLVEGVVTALSIPLTYVQPMAWRKALGVTLPAGSTSPQRKEASRQRALQLFPAHAAKLARKCDHGRAEAALIASWGVRFAALGASAVRPQAHPGARS
jgi:crossover junction endodeoxyribonuclease RuvC